ncbi:MAG: HemK/PrmC family methyltransferase [Microbacteriaceae bacterium]|nr:HemK/PrmC family methyltransferase [Microbacteriaceae bacterium]
MFFETNISRLIALISNFLENSGIASAQTEAQTMVAAAAGFSVVQLRTERALGRDFAPELAEIVAGRLADWVPRRAAREPLQHILGTAPFRHLELLVGPGVFVPRPETELVVEYGLEAVAGIARPIVVDLCAGSGAIGLSFAAEVPESRVFAVELCGKAAEWLARNIVEVASGRVELLRADVAFLAEKLAGPASPIYPFDFNAGTVAPPSAAQQENAAAVLAGLAGRVDLLISNPPYVPEREVPQDKEVAVFDPDLALYSGEDGLALIREIARLGAVLCRPGGAIVIEHTEEQGDAVCQILQAASFTNAETLPDLTARPRASRAVK